MSINAFGARQLRYVMELGIGVYSIFYQLPVTCRLHIHAISLDVLVFAELSVTVCYLSHMLFYTCLRSFVKKF